jgi:hypothetical protein
MMRRGTVDVHAVALTALVSCGWETAAMGALRLDILSLGDPYCSF